MSIDDEGWADDSGNPIGGVLVAVSWTTAIGAAIGLAVQWPPSLLRLAVVAVVVVMAAAVTAAAARQRR